MNDDEDTPHVEELAPATGAEIESWHAPEFWSDAEPLGRQEKAFDPHEKRDAGGKWSATSGEPHPEGAFGAVRHAIHNATDPVEKDFLESAEFNADAGDEKDLARQLASVWAHAHTLGHHVARDTIGDLLPHTGASFHGPEEGDTTAHSGKYYESPRGVFPGDKVTVMRRPIVHEDGHILVKGAVATDGPAFAKAFDPNEPRDGDGKWSDSSSGSSATAYNSGGGSDMKTKRKNLKPNPIPRLDADGEAAMEAALKKAAGDDTVKDFIGYSQSEERVPIASLVSPQTVEDENAVKYFHANPEEIEDAEPLPLVIQHGAKMILRDGNSRTSAAMKHNRTHIKARVVYVPE